MKSKKYYTQVEVDEYVRKLLTDSEIALSKQAERIENEKKENLKLTRELEEYKKKEKASSRLLILSERKAKYLETTTRTKCAAEIERLARLAEKWDSFFANMSNKYDELDREQLEEFKDELSKTIDGMLEMEDLFKNEDMQDATKAHSEEIERLSILKKKKDSAMDERFSKLVMEFNMKIGDHATRGRGRPKKQDSINRKDIEKKLNSKSKTSQKVVYPPVGESGFDFEEALNPTDSLESILSDLID